MISRGDYGSAVVGRIYAGEYRSLQAPLAWACEEVSDPAYPIESHHRSVQCPMFPCRGLINTYLEL